ncbi:MAG: hypothetical protein LC620_01720 [Halobacteriales archaeon]|nr:hypothetical protein [Halobacteriales archaeon]
MKPTTYLLAACVLLLAPLAAADDEPTGDCPQCPIIKTISEYPRCTVFMYGLDPFGYGFHPECLFPLPP